MQTEWLIIRNSHAGSGRTLSAWESASAALSKAGVRFTDVPTAYRGHGAILADEAASGGRRHFLAAGGDGTVHEVFNGLMTFCDRTGTDPSEFTLGVIPVGSGNDWIKTYGIPKDPEGIARVVSECRTCLQDIVRLESDGASPCYMINIGGVGFDSKVCEIVNQQKSGGLRHAFLYLNALRHTISTLHSISCQVIADGSEVFSGSLYSIAVGTGKYSGGGMRQVPAAVPDDGLTDVMIVPHVPVSRILPEVPRLFNGTLDQCPIVSYLKCRRLQIVPLDAESRAVFELDGELKGRLPVDVSVTGQHMKVILGS